MCIKMVMRMEMRMVMRIVTEVKIEIDVEVEEGRVMVYTASEQRCYAMPCYAIICRLEHHTHAHTDKLKYTLTHTH